MSCIPCSDEFFIKRLISKKKKKRKKERRKEGKERRKGLILRFNEFFYFLFHDS